MYVQIIANVVVDESQLSESVHEETDSRTRGPDHLGKSLLADLRNHGFWNAFLAKMREQ